MVLRLVALSLGPRIDGEERDGFCTLVGVFVKETDTDNWLRVTIRKGKLSHISLDNLIQRVGLTIEHLPC